MVDKKTGKGLILTSLVETSGFLKNERRERERIEMGACELLSNSKK
ncbi:MAG: hypothetical protein KBS81_01935 [Spirochaetales bacterium]|nr:hypothetical protein [Candidatus Physcosoma equi]